jgi:two-component system response regulator FixJ
MRIQRFVVAVVDDDHSILRLVEYLMESANCAVRLFASGTALLNSGCLPQARCVIADIDVPGMDGIDLLARIHATRPGVPTILITNYPERLKRLPALDGIYPGVFTRPVQQDALLAAVSDVLRQARTP